MKNDRVSPASHYRVSLRHNEICLILGALAETLEEQRQPYTGLQLRQLTRLHRRLGACVRAPEPDYAMRADGAVVCARDRRIVVVQAPSLADQLRQMGGAGA
jgi:hypothetical protein